MILTFLVVRWGSFCLALAASMESASVNYTDDFVVMLTVKRFTKSGIQHDVEQATSGLMEQVLTMVSEDQHDVSQLLRQDDYLTKLGDVNKLSLQAASDKVTYDDLGKGYCRPKTNYYAKYGLASEACKSQCDRDEDCMAFSFRRDDGGCGIWVPNASKAPRGWSFYSGESVSMITYANGNAQSSCLKKTIFERKSSNGGTETILFNASKTASMQVSFSQGMAFGGIGAVVILFCCIAFFCMQFVRSMDTRIARADTHRGAPIEIWEKKVADVRQYLTKIFQRLDEIEQSEDSPSGYITLKDLDLDQALLGKSLKSELHRMGLSHTDCTTLFQDLDKNNTGFVSVDEFVTGILRLADAHPHHHYYEHDESF